MRPQRGFSLVEMLVVMVILSIVMVIVGQFIASQTTIMRKQQVMANTQQSVRVSAELITRDLGYACLNPAGAPAPTFAFQRFQDSVVVFTTDLNGNGVLDNVNAGDSRRDELRGFRLRGDTLVRIRQLTPALVSEDVATGIDSLRFSYWTRDDVAVPPRAAPPESGRIARVNFRIVAVSPYRMNQNIIRSTGSMVVVRNRAF